MRKLINRRLPVQQSMPPLAEACGSFKGFQEGEKRLDRIHEILLVVIQRFRGAEEKRFYAMREVAAFFGVALRTVAIVYARLNAEGVLIQVRSSQTMIAARTPRPRFAVRGVVCMPIWLPGFLQFLDWRKWFSLLEEELSRYRFVSEPIFYKQGEEITPGFVDRVLKFNPDCILWHNPSRGDVTTMKSLTDTGVTLVTVQDSPGQFPGRIYHQSYGKALQEGLKEWEESGEIEQIIIPQLGPFNPAVQLRKAALGTGKLPHRYKFIPSEQKASFADYLRQLISNRRAGIIFLDDAFYTRLCLKFPEAMTKLMRRHRVMVLREVVMPLAVMPELSVDAVLFPWKKLARRIAADLNQAKGLVTSSQVVFEAEWHSRLPLKKVMRCGFRE